MLFYFHPGDLGMPFIYFILFIVVIIALAILGLPVLIIYKAFRKSKNKESDLMVFKDTEYENSSIPKN